MNSSLVEVASQKSTDWMNIDRCENRQEENICLDKKPICPCCSCVILVYIKFTGIVVTVIKKCLLLITNEEALKL